MRRSEPQNCPPDEVETRIPDVATATALLKDQHSTILWWLTERRDQYAARFGDNPLLEKSIDAAVISLARVSTRHGSLGEDHHHYHDEIHPTALLGRLFRIYDSPRGNEIDTHERLYLATFACAHDLRQRAGNQVGTDGVGGNERASADEWRRIMDIVGFDRDKDADVYELTTLMIHGTTFNTGFGPEADKWPLGALAPRLVADITAQHADWQERPELRRQLKLIPLAADIDTGSVADPFEDYALEATNLAREMEGRKGNGVLDASTAPGVLGFLTDGQERFFFELQQFNSDIARDVFAETKEANSRRLKELSGWMRENYSDAASDGRATGEDIVSAFLDKARQIAARDLKAARKS